MIPPLGQFFVILRPFDSLVCITIVKCHFCSLLDCIEVTLSSLGQALFFLASFTPVSILLCSQILFVQSIGANEAALVRGVGVDPLISVDDRGFELCFLG